MSLYILWSATEKRYSMEFFSANFKSNSLTRKVQLSLQVNSLDGAGVIEYPRISTPYPITSRQILGSAYDTLIGKSVYSDKHM